MDTSLLEMYQRILRALKGVKYENTSTPVFTKALEWITRFPPELDPGLRRQLIEVTCGAFSLQESELWVLVDGVGAQLVVPVKQPIVSLSPLREAEEKFRLILPKGGWFEWYDDFTKGVEVPLSYSIFTSLSAIGSALGRRVYLRMGHFNIYPNFCTILIGPPGLKKTTAGDIATKLVREQACCAILADQVTPERMISVLKESGHHFIYAAEMAVFFGKQKYNEGLVTKMLRMLDSPSEYIVETQARGTETLTDLAISFIGCTTPALLSHSMPDEVTSSGFMSRFVLVVERDTWREFAIPQEPPKNQEIKLQKQLRRLKGLVGEMRLGEDANKWYHAWYHQYKNKMRTLGDETTAEILARTPAHMLRTAMLVHLVQCDDFLVCAKCMEAAANMITYTEDSAPKAFQSLKQNTTANDMDYVVATLLRLGGAADHSTLLRRVASRMSTVQLKAQIRTLEESGRVKVGKQRSGAVYYILLQDGESAHA